ncbi:hypothetical protein N5280_002467 [Vibrio vulnificus]|nr:hypothetical protein [Vibrio vulnificus]
MKSPQQFELEYEFVELVADRYFAPEQCSFSHAFDVAIFHKGEVMSRNKAFRRVASMVMVNREIIKSRGLSKAEEKKLLAKFNEITTLRDRRMAFAQMNRKAFQVVEHG